MVKQFSVLYFETRQALLVKEDAQTAGFMARNILCHVLGKTHEQLLAQSDMYATQRECEQVGAALDRLLHDEPLAYVLGQWEFYGMPLQVDRRVLIPRDDTCAVTELAIDQVLCLGGQPRILDLCTGSGCIGLAIAAHIPDAHLTLADLSQEALTVARANTAHLNLRSRVNCVAADALQSPPPFLGKFDMIVSNPPYVTTQEMESLPDSVRNYEPHMALCGGEDGLDFYRAVAKNYAKALKPGGYLCFEHGMGQADAVCAILEENGYRVLKRAKDTNQIERAVLARYRKEDKDDYKKDSL